jgi:biopolymer transport protein TolR
MALSTTDAFAAAGGASRRRRRGRGRRAALSEINVTPLVDVMLVLLIIFMISAPLLTNGVQVELPKTEAGAVQDQNQPLTLTVKADGQLYANEEQIPFAALKPRMEVLAQQNFDKPIYVRADGKASWTVVAQVMAALQATGFTKISLITDSGGPSSGPSSGEAAKPAPAGP